MEKERSTFVEKDQHLKTHFQVRYVIITLFEMEDQMDRTFEVAPPLQHQIKELFETGL